MIQRIGIVGPAGAGKTKVAEFLASKRLFLIDADRLGHQILNADRVLQQELITAFGNGILQPDGNVSRRKLSEVAFYYTDNLSTINLLIGSRLKALLEQKLFSSETPLPLVVDAALLWEWKLAERLDYIVYVTADRVIRKKRLKLRGMSARASEFLISLCIGIPSAEHTFDFMIENDGKEEMLTRKCKALWKHLQNSGLQPCA